MSQQTASAMLIILGGLPGAGKTTVARALARRIGAMHVRIDTIEQALRNSDRHLEVGDEGYRVAFAVAEDNLRLGRTVVADSVNPIAITRDAWHAVAQEAGVAYFDVEVVCSDREEHRHRVESRVADIEGHKLPTWQDVLDREWEAWAPPVLVIDTAKLSLEEAVAAIQQAERL